MTLGEGAGRALRVALSAAFVVVSTCGCRERIEQKVVRDIAQSHIDGNVPDPGDFDTLLRRDLQSYLVSAGYKSVLIHYELLRDGPTQTGIAYPKFYAWIQADAGDGTFTEGVARLAAVKKKEFQVTDFILSSELRQNPGRVWDTFPVPLCPEILERAGMENVEPISGR